MTAIIGRHCPVRGEIVIAADSRTCWGGAFMDDAETSSKIYQGNKWALALAGSCRMSYLLDGIFPEINECLENGDIHEFAAAFKRATVKDDFTPRDDDAGPKGYGHDGLIATGGNLYYLATDFTPALVPLGKVFGCGSGSDLAVGAATALLLGRNPTKKSTTWAIRAIEIAIANDRSCGFPVQLAVVPGEKG